jgi:CO/xanthine dehydrogenase Mo-binding subunit
VVAETEAAAEEGCRRIEVEYEMLPAVLDPEAAMRPGAPLVHGDKVRPAPGIARAADNVVGELHAELGDVEAGLRRGRRRLRGDLPHRPGAARAAWRRTARSAGSTTTAGWWCAPARRPRS